MDRKFKIFMVEDDLNFGNVLKSYLEINDFDVTWIDDGGSAISEFKKGNFDICLLDVMLPNIDGFEIARAIKMTSETPIVFLTSKTLKTDILEGFKIGADDYITKPFDSEVLLMKIRVILKRSTNSSNLLHDISEYKLGKYEFFPKSRLITDGKIEQKLSPKESDLLKMLCIHQNRVLPRETTLKEIWGNDNYFTARSMDVYITKLRKYLSDEPLVHIENIHSTGYILHVRLPE
ncbi:MAG: response regulator transcription factor [Bacteroidota bacterium]